MMFVHIEGTLDELRGLTTLKGLELQRGAHDLGGGRWRASGVVRVKSLIDDIKARGLTVTVTSSTDPTFSCTRGVTASWPQATSPIWSAPTASCWTPCTMVRPRRSDPS